ncbi:LemA family protein [Candidatus Cerribacteria bacterium 'Amazon FNV 2010 28 9']|uniref:LemA family protein n=1 Tax=Candidatus Cerribacteria bacterium 'Amazon FNV 2010 28 9' TaxID=2081795 RepID=A0A317JNS1_9BACT|nr:MAG: LemA family protein [Candidatus Cerribacteria bacterium 'Amazon FNV 2010 28 9']
MNTNNNNGNNGCLRMFEFGGISCLVVAIIVGCIALSVGGYVVSKFNGMVSVSNDVAGKWAQVENDYQRRTDLYTSEVSTIKGMTAQERAYFDTFTQEAAALSQSLSQYYAGTGSESALDAQLTKTNNALVDVKSYVFDAHPELKSDALFSAFMTEIEGTENRITVSRQDYNNAVTAYRNAIQVFPVNIFAASLGYGVDKYPYFQAQPGADKAPVIDFSTPAPATQVPAR